MAATDDGTAQLSELPGDSYMNPQSFVLEGQDGNDSLVDDHRGEEAPLREQDRFLPIANVARIMKYSIPNNGKIAKDAKECVQECVSEFISFITSEASERCHQEKRKTINGEDILFAMSTLGFDNYVEPLKLYLQKYRESIKGDKGVSAAQADIYMEDMGEDYNAIPRQLLDDPGQQNVIYTYPTGVGSVQQLSFS